jgi:mono/diheme cytochrome c family protein
MKESEITKTKLSGQVALIVGIGFVHMLFSPDTAVAATGDAALGAELYNQYCVGCHGDSAIGLAKFNGELERLQFMLNGESVYMPDFTGMFTDEEINNIHAFLTSNAE